MTLPLLRVEKDTAFESARGLVAPLPSVLNILSWDPSVKLSFVPTALWLQLAFAE